MPSLCNDGCASCLQTTWMLFPGGTASHDGLVRARLGCSALGVRLFTPDCRERGLVTSMTMVRATSPRLLVSMNTFADSADDKDTTRLRRMAAACSCTMRLISCCCCFFASALSFSTKSAFSRASPWVRARPSRRRSVGRSCRPSARLARRAWPLGHRTSRTARTPSRPRRGRRGQWGRTFPGEAAFHVARHGESTRAALAFAGGRVSRALPHALACSP